MATRTPPELLEGLEPDPTIEDLCKEAADLQAQIGMRDAEVVKQHRQQLVAWWEAARTRSQVALDRFVAARAYGLLEDEGRFDATGLADLNAALAPEFDAAMRERIKAMDAQTIANHVHPPVDDRLSLQLGQVTHQIAVLEEQERRMARLRHNPRNPTPKED
jgi:hypothetical protein